MSMSGISNDWKSCLNVICYLYTLALNHRYSALFWKLRIIPTLEACTHIEETLFLLMQTLDI